MNLGPIRAASPPSILSVDPECRKLLAAPSPLLKCSRSRDEWIFSELHHFSAPLR